MRAGRIIGDGPVDDPVAVKLKGHVARLLLCPLWLGFIGALLDDVVIGDPVLGYQDTDLRMVDRDRLHDELLVSDQLEQVDPTPERPHRKKRRSLEHTLPSDLEFDDLGCQRRERRQQRELNALELDRCIEPLVELVVHERCDSLPQNDGDDYDGADQQPDQYRHRDERNLERTFHGSLLPHPHRSPAA